MELKLLVIRSISPQKLADFYTLLGLKFEYHQHGNSPFHYTTTIGQTVLELYPLAKNQAEVDKHLRLGFGIEDFEATIQNLKKIQTVFISEPAFSDFGFMAIALDPDGRKVELYKK